MKILVTGGAGFIGSHLVDRLLTLGHDVIVLDRFTDGIGEHLIHGDADKRLRLYKVDLTKSRQIKDNFFKGVDWVFHLAGLSSNTESLKYPREYHIANVDATVNVLEKSKTANVKRLIFASSAACYGFSKTATIAETAKIAPANPYGLTKYIAESYILHWASVYKLSAICLRFFSVCGPQNRQSGGYGAVITKFIEQKNKGLPILLDCAPRDFRDLVYIDDAIDALLKAAKSKVTSGIFNVGTGVPVTIGEVAKLIDGDTRFINSESPALPSLVSDNSKILKVLGWKPKVTFKQGIKQVLASLNDLNKE